MSTDAGFTFRKTTWGMTKEEVRKSEDAQLEKEVDNSLLLKAEVMGFASTLHYNFEEGKLFFSGYWIQSEASECYDIFLKFQAALENKYGRPTDQKTEWKSTKHKKQPEMWGYAVAYGQLEVSVSWQTESTMVDLILQSVIGECVTDEVEYDEGRGASGVVVCIDYFSSAYSENQRCQFLEGTDSPENLANL